VRFEKGKGLVWGWKVYLIGNFVVGHQRRHVRKSLLSRNKGENVLR
jgi:hypothetical protein